MTKSSLLGVFVGRANALGDEVSFRYEGLAALSSRVSLTQKQRSVYILLSVPHKAMG
ncbi:MAG TPA: hypothetical protein VN948_01215 [Terriglobales bacterium]|nr:hypothetical protein [Terriglobales bacterium]